MVTSIWPHHRWSNSWSTHIRICSLWIAELGPHFVLHVVSLVPFLALFSVELEQDLFQELQLLRNFPLEDLPSLIVVSSHPMRRLELSF